MEVQKVLSNEESTPITFEFYSHGACGTDNATTSYSRHACLVHQVLIQRHALFPVAESFKETTVTMYTLLPTPHRFLLRLSRNLDTLGFARVNKNEGCKGGGGERGGIRNSRGTRANGSGGRVQKSSTIFVFTVRLRTVRSSAVTPSIHGKNERSPVLGIDFLSQSWIARVVFPWGGREEEKNLL